MPNFRTNSGAGRQLVVAVDRDVLAPERISANSRRPKRSHERAWPNVPLPKWREVLDGLRSDLRPIPSRHQRRSTSSRASKHSPVLELWGLPQLEVEAGLEPRSLQPAGPMAAEHQSVVPERPEERQRGPKERLVDPAQGRLDRPVGAGMPEHKRLCARRNPLPGRRGSLLRVSVIQFS
jgi:hypothetical protein